MGRMAMSCLPLLGMPGSPGSLRGGSPHTAGPYTLGGAWTDVDERGCPGGGGLFVSLLSSSLAGSQHLHGPPPTGLAGLLPLSALAALLP